MIPRWMRQLKVGDMVKSRSGRVRIIRAISSSSNQVSNSYVYFTIARCSWTGRCYTLLNFNDMRQFGYKPVGRSRKRWSKLDKRILDEMRKGAQPPEIKCCDVTGIP